MLKSQLCNPDRRMSPHPLRASCWGLLSGFVYQGLDAFVKVCIVFVCVTVVGVCFWGQGALGRGDLLQQPHDNGATAACRFGCEYVVYLLSYSRLMHPADRCMCFLVAGAYEHVVHLHPPRKSRGCSVRGWGFGARSLRAVILTADRTSVGQCTIKCRGV